MSKHDLFISLGHNSSAMLAIDDRIVVGYEQERLDRKKSSSAYPRDAIALCMEKAGTRIIDTAYVSHWFDHFELAASKYLDIRHLRGITNKIISLSPDRTHHDAHAGSAVAFLESHAVNFDDPAYIIVLDGFGSLQECFSVYCHIPGRSPVRVHRTYGYDMSLGLMYQYATEYLGMKPNQDEYKLLGYEARILDYATRERAEYVREAIRLEALSHANDMLRATTKPPAAESLIDYAALATAKTKWTERVSKWRSMFPYDEDPKAGRVFVAFCAQSFIEATVSALLDILVPVNAHRISLVGGCFLNVKLNRTIQQRPGLPLVFAHPLSGDQGAALGLSPSVMMNTLCIGHRSIDRLPDADMFEETDGVFLVDETDWPEFVGDFVNEGRIVNVLRGPMEYGPRALCNTTTFALPSIENVRRINLLNDRDDAMPMAPVMTPAAAHRILETSEIARMVISDRYMITTAAFRQEPPDQLRGVAHRDPIERVWTARPQIVKEDAALFELLDTTPDQTLINTSFNYHGEPIIMTAENAVHTHTMQCQRAKAYGEKAPITVLVRS